MLSWSFTGKLIKMSWDLRMETGGKGTSRKEKALRRPWVRYRRCGEVKWSLLSHSGGVRAKEES